MIEAVAERASIQNLITTPVGGYILGELSHRATYENEEERVYLFGEGSGFYHQPDVCG